MVIISKILLKKQAVRLITLVSFECALLRSNGQYSARVNIRVGNRVNKTLAWQVDSVEQLTSRILYLLATVVSSQPGSSYPLNEAMYLVVYSSQRSLERRPPFSSKCKNSETAFDGVSHAHAVEANKHDARSARHFFTVRPLRCW